MILIPLLAVLSLRVIQIEPLDCSDSELNVIVRQVQPFETNGTGKLYYITEINWSMSITFVLNQYWIIGLFTDAVQSALEYCCYPARPNLSLAIVRSEADLIANRLIWDSTFLYYPTAYKSQLHFIPLIQSPGTFMPINYFQQAADSHLFRIGSDNQVFYNNVSPG